MQYAQAVQLYTGLLLLKLDKTMLAELAREYDNKRVCGLDKRMTSIL